MKNKYLLTQLIIAGAMLGGLASCGAKPSKAPLKSEETLKLQTVTGMQSIGGIGGGRMGRLSALLAAKDDKPLTDVDLNKIKDFVLPSVEVIMANGFDLTSTHTKLEADKKITIEEVAFEFVDKITFKLNDKSTTYSLIFNEAKVESEEKKEEDGTEIEVVSKIEGFVYEGDYDLTLIAPDASVSFLTFLSEVEKETKDNETEEERTLRISRAEDTYIEINQENEVEDGVLCSEFCYKVVDKGEVKVDFSIEVENAAENAIIEIEFGEIEYEISTKTIDGKVVYLVEMENDATDAEAEARFVKNEDGTFSVYVATEAPNPDTSAK
ncbi:MAG: hypothetical protein RR909_03840 [Bacilli bacterium]